MGNIDSIPVISQMKSLVQIIGGDSKGALETQENFAYRNTFPVVSQIASLGYAIDGKMDEARDLQEKFAQDMNRVIDSIPVAGHVKGTVHFALGQNAQGEEAMKAASHTTAVVAGGIGGFLVGGPAGAVAGGVSGGAGMDSLITASENLIYGPTSARPYGYCKLGDQIANGEIDTIGLGFNAAMVPVVDGVTGLAAGASGIGSSNIAGSGIVNSLPKPTLSSASKIVLDIIAPGKPRPGPGFLGTIGSVAGGVAGVAGLDGIKNIITASEILFGGPRPTKLRHYTNKGHGIAYENETDGQAGGEGETGAAVDGIMPLESGLKLKFKSNTSAIDNKDNRANQLNPNHIEPDRPEGFFFYHPS